MTRADLHVHSKASRRPSEWFLQKAGAGESYTDVHTLYQFAKSAGMDFVTITDHNTIEGALELTEAYPDDTFISVETTTYFPENNCKIHLLIYNITPQQFDEIEALRRNIYHLREYILERGLTTSVAHGFYNINGRLDADILEKLILLFDVFEGLNGARSRNGNNAWQEILKKLTPELIRSLSERHGITPIGDNSWVKGFTGGSDDHAGLFIGCTATTADEEIPDPATFLEAVRLKRTGCTGRCNDYKSFAFSIYKIFCDYSTHTGKSAPGGVIQFINSIVFEEKQSRLRRWLTYRKVKKRKQAGNRILLTFFEDVYNWSHDTQLDVETKMSNIYHSMALLVDEFFKLFIRSVEKDLVKGDIGRLLKNLLTALPAFFISVPFFSSLKHLSQDRALLAHLHRRFYNGRSKQQTKTLWFTDTFRDLNGVSVTLGRFCKAAAERNLDLTFVTCSDTDAGDDTPTPGLITLPAIYSLTPEFYSTYTLNFPSLLNAMETIYECRPQRIVISTPGPVGILGMTMARILGIESTTIYHTDFAAQSKAIFRDEALAGFIASAVNRFYAFSTHIKVPTRQYMEILEAQGYPPEKMSLFRRGVTPDPLGRDRDREKAVKDRHGIQPGFTLLWAGRVSRDKNIDFLMDVYLQACGNGFPINLVVCGNGPDLDALQRRYRHQERIHFTGFIENSRLKDYYDIADLFVFPSTTDTFGMVILEAQSRGVPALVSDVGGPQEIIRQGETGHSLPVTYTRPWVDHILAYDHMKRHHPQEFDELQKRCHAHIADAFHWDRALADILWIPVESIASTSNGKQQGRNKKADTHHPEPRQISRKVA